MRWYWIWIDVTDSLDFQNDLKTNSNYFLIVMIRAHHQLNLCSSMKMKVVFQSCKNRSCPRIKQNLDRKTKSIQFNYFKRKICVEDTHDIVWRHKNNSSHPTRDDKKQMINIEDKHFFVFVCVRMCECLYCNDDSKLVRISVSSSRSSSSFRVFDKRLKARC